MKRFPLLPQVALVLAVAYACTDSTSPALSNAVAVGNQRASVVGKQPPPPVATAITITVSGGTSLAARSLTAAFFVAAPFTGKYFSNKNDMAWLKLDNSQPTTLGTASGNAEFKAHGTDFMGAGRLMIEGHEVIITSVEAFFANPECGITGEVCAQIEFTATVDGDPGQQGQAEAFDKDTCTLYDPGEGDPFFICGSGE